MLTGSCEQKVGKSLPCKARSLALAGYLTPRSHEFNWFSETTTQRWCIFPTYWIYSCRKCSPNIFSEPKGYSNRRGRAQIKVFWTSFPSGPSFHHAKRFYYHITYSSYATQVKWQQSSCSFLFQKVVNLCPRLEIKLVNIAAIAPTRDWRWPKNCKADFSSIQPQGNLSAP